MPLRLRDPKTVPRDGFLFVEPSNGRRFGGMYSFKYVVNEVVGYRKGNNIAGATQEQVSTELDNQTCNRDPSWCFDSSVRVAESVRQTSGCSSCGIVTT